MKEIGKLLGNKISDINNLQYENTDKEFLEIEIKRLNSLFNSGFLTGIKFQRKVSPHI